jgi:DNA repair exonuclease SbcCD ATPase subunit
MARKIIKDQKDLLDLLSTVQKEPTEGPALPDRLVHHQLQLESLEIENLWSYKRASLRFEPGITVIAGPNGSGKSSLLESIFFALYGSEARHSMGRSLDEIVRIGADSGSVKLSFFYGGKRYHAQVSLRRVAGTMKSERGGCQLTCDDGSAWVGTENVVAEIERLFGMDREGFTNCVYIRQGEIDRLIRADRKDREQMLDGLLGLSKLDLYVTPRSKEALRAINRKLEIIAESLARVRAEIEDLERQGLFAQKSQLTEQLERLHSELAAIDDSRTTAHKLLQSYEEDLRREAQLERELAQLEHELAEKEKRLGQREAERAAAEKELSTISARHQKRLSALKARLHQMGLDSALETLEAAKTSDDVTPLVERIESHRAHLERTRAQLGELREHVAQVRAERAGHERALAHLRQQHSDLERERARVADQIAQLERKLSALTEALTQHEQSVAALLDDLVRARWGSLGWRFPRSLRRGTSRRPRRYSLLGRRSASASKLTTLKLSKLYCTRRRTTKRSVRSSPKKKSSSGLGAALPAGSRCPGSSSPRRSPRSPRSSASWSSTSTTRKPSFRALRARSRSGSLFVKRSISLPWSLSAARRGGLSSLPSRALLKRCARARLLWRSGSPS